MSGNTCAPTSSQAASGTTTTLSSRPAPKPGTGSSAIRIAFDPSAQETGRRSMSRAVGISRAIEIETVHYSLDPLAVFGFKHPSWNQVALEKLVGDWCGHPIDERGPQRRIISHQLHGPLATEVALASWRVAHTKRIGISRLPRSGQNPKIRGRNDTKIIR